jgi:queuine tRNA-ribosyltransferase
LKFEVLQTVEKARLGRLECAHGVIETPNFMPVGTLGAVKGLGPRELRGLGAQVMLCNLYHLAVRPGIDALEALGGLHRFNGWQGPILTDSGGYQIFSLEGLRKIDDGGVTFRNHYDGDRMRFTPENVVEMQQRIGVDFAMMLDECPPWPVNHRDAAESLERTQRWAERARAAWGQDSAGDTSLFGIVQGSFYGDLRERAARELVELDFPGYAIGGVSVGEGTELGQQVVDQVTELLPADRPRYLMGLGLPTDLMHAVEQGIDLFDCVLPTRNARHGNLFTRNGVVRIKNSRYKRDDRPIDPTRPDALEGISRAFLHHLFKTGEITAKVLATQHNLGFYLDFMGDLRQALRSGSWADLRQEITANLANRTTV